MQQNFECANKLGLLDWQPAKMVTRFKFGQNCDDHCRVLAGGPLANACGATNAAITIALSSRMLPEQTQASLLLLDIVGNLVARSGKRAGSLGISTHALAFHQNGRKNIKRR